MIKMRYVIEKKCFHEKNDKFGIFSLALAIKLGGSMTEDRQGSEGLTEFMTM